MSLNQLINPSGGILCDWANYECYNLNVYQGITATNMNITNMNVSGLTASIINGVTGNINTINSNVINGVTGNINTINSNVINGVTATIQTQINLGSIIIKPLEFGAGLTTLTIPKGNGTSRPLLSVTQTVTQQTSPSTAIIIDAPCGIISTFTSTLAPNATESFAINNLYIGLGKSIAVQVVGLGTTQGIPYVYSQIDLVNAGVCRIYVTNLGTLPFNGNLLLYFQVI